MSRGLLDSMDRFALRTNDKPHDGMPVYGNESRTAAAGSR